MQVVANNSDVLSIIAAFVRNLPPRTLAPPDPERVRLRAQNVELHTEAFKLRELLDEYRLREAELQQLRQVHARPRSMRWVKRQLAVSKSTS